MKKNLMRMALLCIIFTISLSAFAADKADVYTEGLKTLMMNGGVNILNTEQLSKLSVATGGSADQFVDDMVEIISPYYRDNMSEEEFKQMLAFYQKPEIIAITKKLADGSNASLDQLSKDIMARVMQMMQGGEMEPIKVEGCSEEFIKAFDRFYTLSNTDKSMESAMAFVNQMFNRMKQSIPAGQQEQFMTMMNKLLSFMKENMKPLTMMVLSKSLTVDDLNTFCTVTDEPFYPAMQKVYDAVAADMPAIMQKATEKIKIPGM